MSSDIAIKVENLSKCYQIYEQPRDRLKQFVMPRLQRALGKQAQQYYREFWALKDVSFEVKKGETVGIIGRNGSGKSTLLQIICGTLNPTSGTVTTHGRIAALLELGSGFNPDFTGRENVYMNAAVLGLSNDEIDQRFDAIAAFADIGEFIEQPVRTYSSGMMVRLAFAVQSQVDPNILVVDEALSVGDAKFQAKCFERLRHLKENGTSILLVTHSSEQIVTHCSLGVLLEAGNNLLIDEPRSVVNRYMDLLFGKELINPNKEITQPNLITGSTMELGFHKISLENDNFHNRLGYNPHEYRWGDGAAIILDYCLSVGNDVYPASINTGQLAYLSVSVKFLKDFIRPIFGITIKTKEGVTVYGVNSETLECVEFRDMGECNSIVQVATSFYCRLSPGDYFISIGVATKQGVEVIPHDRRYDAIHFQVMPNNTFFGIADLELSMHAKRVEANV